MGSLVVAYAEWQSVHISSISVILEWGLFFKIFANNGPIA